MKSKPSFAGLTTRGSGTPEPGFRVLREPSAAMARFLLVTRIWSQFGLCRGFGSYEVRSQSWAQLHRTVCGMKACGRVPDLHATMRNFPSSG